MTSEMMKSRIPSGSGSTRELWWAAGGPWWWSSWATAAGIAAASMGSSWLVRRR